MPVSKLPCGKVPYGTVVGWKNNRYEQSMKGWTKKVARAVMPPPRRYTHDETCADLQPLDAAVVGVGAAAAAAAAAAATGRPRLLVSPFSVKRAEGTGDFGD